MYQVLPATPPLDTPVWKAGSKGLLLEIEESRSHVGTSVLRDCLGVVDGVYTLYYIMVPTKVPRQGTYILILIVVAVVVAVAGRFDILLRWYQQRAAP